MWKNCELLFICSPGNPTGAVMPLDQLTALIELADRYDFVIASDECYSEIYPDESRPPPGLLQACAALGRDDFARCVVFHSLSKRSNLPGLRSGFVAGDAAILDRFFLYRTYHGCAMPAHVQHVSELAWARRNVTWSTTDAAYREKFAVSHADAGARCSDVHEPEGGFYYWPRTPIDDEAFTRGCSSKKMSPCCPGRYLSRTAQRRRSGSEPGSYGDGRRVAGVHRRRGAHRHVSRARCERAASNVRCVRLPILIASAGMFP